MKHILYFLQFYQKRRRNTLSNVKNQNVRKEVDLNNHPNLLLLLVLFFWKKLNWFCIIFGSPIVHLALFFTVLFLVLLIYYFLQQIRNSSLNDSFLQISPSVLPFNSLKPTVHFIPQKIRTKCYWSVFLQPICYNHFPLYYITESTVHHLQEQGGFVSTIFKRFLFVLFPSSFLQLPCDLPHTPQCLVWQ